MTRVQILKTTTDIASFHAKITITKNDKGSVSVEWMEVITTKGYKAKDSVVKALRSIAANANSRLTVERHDNNSTSMQIKSANGTIVLSCTVPSDRVAFIKDTLAMMDVDSVAGVPVEKAAEAA